MSIHCPNCDRLIPEGSKECPYCGVVIEKAVRRAALMQPVSARRKPPTKTTYYFYAAIGVLSVLILVVAFAFRPHSATSVNVPSSAPTATKPSLPSSSLKVVVSEPKWEWLNQVLRIRVPPLDSEDSEAASLFNRSVWLAENHRFGECAELVRRFCKDNPQTCYKSAAWRAIAGKCFYAAGGAAFEFKLWSRAVEYLGLARVYQPIGGLLQKQYALAYCALGKLTQCKAELLRALRQSPEDSSILRALTALSLIQNEPTKAVRFARTLDKTAQPKGLQTLISALAARRRAGLKTDFMRISPAVEGFNVRVAGNLDAAQRPLIEQFLRSLRDKATSLLRLGNLPQITVVLDATRQPTDFVRSRYGCRAVRTSTVVVPMRTGAILLPYVQQAVANAYVQAILGTITQGEAPCWLAAGLGCLLEEDFGWKPATGGMQNLPELLPPEQIERPAENAPFGRVALYFAQACAALRVAAQAKGRTKVMACVQTAANSTDFEAEFLDCLGYDDLYDLFDETVERYGGRVGWEE